MGNGFSRNGFITKAVERYVPLGGLITAPIHAIAGNHAHALQAALSGVRSGMVTVGSMAGPAGAAAASAVSIATDAILDGLQKETARTDTVLEGKMKSAPVLAAVVEQAGEGGVSEICDQMCMSRDKKEAAVQAARTGDASRAGQILLEAGNAKIAESTKALSAEAGGRRSLRSADGSYLRAVEPNWTVDMVQRPPKEWENWYIEDWHGKVVLKGRGAPNKPGQFLRAYDNGSVDLTGKHPKDEPLAIWKPFKNDDGSWSFLSIHGTWLSADSNGSVSTVSRCDRNEHFWLERW